MAGVAERRPMVMRLVADISDGAFDDGLNEELGRWLGTSHRYRAFVTTYRDKIRKKLRAARHPEARRDTRVELLVARLLLAERKIELAFEPYGSGRLGPDFGIAFRGHPALNLEVTRIRGTPTPAGLRGTLLAKLRQLPSGAPNALLVAVDDDTADDLDVASAARALRARADAKDEAFFTSRGLEGSRAFYDRYLRLGGVFVLPERATVGGAGATLWVNRSARIPLPDRAARACLVALQGTV